MVGGRPKEHRDEKVKHGLSYSQPLMQEQDFNDPQATSEIGVAPVVAVVPVVPGP